MHRFSSKALNLLAALVAMAGLVASARAAISVGASGAGPLTFDAAPTGGDFLSAYYPGLGTTFATVENMDMAIANLAATVFTPDFVLGTSMTMPPSPYAYAFRHNTTGLFLQSRPTTVSGTGPNSAGIVMMATLQNDTGSDQTGIVLSYELTVTDPVAGELPGHRVYFSVSGEAGSWIVIPELSGVETTGPQTGQLNLGNWPNGSQMFILWFDDNANGVTDPGMAIDNLTIALGTGPKTPVSITQQTNLVDRTLAERQGLVYSISATGSPIQFRWFHGVTELVNSTNCVNGHDRIVSGAHTATLRINSVEPSDSGDYRCEVSNPLGSAVSDTATLTVTPDTNAPTILFAYPGGAPNEIIVVFSEPLNDGCTGVQGGGAVSDPQNWSVVDIGGNDLGVFGLTNQNDIRGQTTIGLRTEFQHDATLPFRVRIESLTGFTDTAVAQNVITGGTYRLVTPLLALDSMWNFNDLDIDPGADWFTSDPGIFGPGIAPFDAKRDGGLLHPNGLDDCRANTLYELGAVGTCLALESQATLTNLITAYFWTQFSFSGDLNNSDLFFIGKADDGAVVYLNGSELGRIRMPAAPTEITHTTFATGAVGDPDPRDRILVPRPRQLQSGDNLLAISLHQAALTSSDLTLGYQVFAIEPTSTVRVNVSFSGGNPVISWSPDGGRLEFKNNINDPTWTVLGTSNPFTDASGQANRFYRVFFP